MASYAGLSLLHEASEPGVKNVDLGDDVEALERRVMELEANCIQKGEVRPAAIVRAKAATEAVETPAEPEPPVDWVLGADEPTTINFKSFVDATGKLPPHMVRSHEHQEEWSVVFKAMEKKGERQPYVDPEPVTLDAITVQCPPKVSQQRGLARNSEFASEHQAKQLEHRDRESQQKVVDIHKIMEEDERKPIHVWRRPAVWRPTASLFAKIPQGGRYYPQFNQGVFHDGYFLLAVAAAACHPRAFRSLWVSCVHADVGMYSFQFHEVADILQLVDPEMVKMESRWKCITIDDQIPCDGHANAILSTSANESELWVVLLTKAYAKFLGSYTHLHQGDHVLAMAHLTAGTTLTFRWYSEIGGDDRSVLWWYLLEGTRHQLIMTCGTSVGRLIRKAKADRTEPEEVDTSGEDKMLLHRLDADEYAQWSAGCVILRVVQIGARRANELLPGKRFMEPLKLVQVLTPIASPDFNKGREYSWDSPVWANEELRAELNETESHPSVGWMSYSEFLEAFNVFNTTITTDTPVVYDTLRPVEPGHMSHSAHQYLLTVQQAVVDHYKEPNPDASLQVSFFVSQPDRDSVNVDYTDGVDLPEVIEWNLFDRGNEASLQRCYNDNEGEYDILEDDTEEEVYVQRKVPKKPSYLWPEGDKHAREDIPTATPFEMRAKATLKAGYYVVTIQQSQHFDEIFYTFSTQYEDPDETGLLLTVRPLGSVAEPAAPVYNRRR